jgi:GntR family transcriptional regulator, transcriptional repressor for pyruvate dehydrogenase complex
MPNMLADDIRRQLVAGELLPGQALPPERELLQAYGISRPTLREALRILEAESLVEMVRGPKGGITVRAPDPVVVVRQVGVHLQLTGASFADVYAARAALEIASVRTVAEEKRSDDVLALRKLVEDGRKCTEDSTIEYSHAAGRFHRELVHRAGNKTMSFVVDTLTTLTDATYYRRASSLEPGERETAMRKSTRSWSKVVDLIEAGDPDGAEAHWTRHMAYVGSRLDSEDRPLAAEVLPHFNGHK